MKHFFPSVLAANFAVWGAVCGPVFAQGAAVAEAPANKVRDQLQFNLNYRVTSDKNGKVSTQFETGFGRIFPEKTVKFEKTQSSRGGVPLRETVWFLGAKGQQLGSLETVFDAKGALQSQNLRVGKAAPRALNWFKTKALSSPEITVPGAIVRARFARKGALLWRRVLTMGTELGPHVLETAYDASGRRLRDQSAGAEKTTTSGMRVEYAYGAQGLSRISTFADEVRPTNIKVSYLPSGALGEMIFTRAGVMLTRMSLGFEGAKMVSQRTEEFENGALRYATTLQVEAGRELRENYENGALISRTTFQKQENGKLQAVSHERWSGGVLQSRLDFDANGKVIRETIFNADGTVKEVNEAK